jgi:hypothetical protein
MPKIDDITRSLRDLVNRLALEGKRTATITHLRLELTRLDRRRKDLFARLGDRINELRLGGKIIDSGLLGLLQSELEDIDRVNKEIEDTLELIQEVNLEGATVSEQVEKPDEERQKVAEGLLESFDVL